MATQVVQTNFGSGTQPPPALAGVIEQVSKQYGIPADLLAGIWRQESGGRYPNPYVNDSGYGGLFGTRNWNASTLEQAQTAASVLAAGLQKSGGNIAEALSYYNSGKLQGGYTSVPGEVSYGSISVPQNVPTQAQTGSIGTPLGSTSIYQSSGAQAAVGAGKKAVSSAEGLISFVTSWRFAEVVGGFVLLVVGLLLLGRQFGVDGPGAATVAARTPGVK